MPYTIDIDTGGTFTDGFITSNGIARRVKVDTTPHDLTVCFNELISAAASSFGVSTADMLADTAVVRYSTTVGTNAIIQKTGPKLGLLVSAGHEQDLYAPGTGERAFLDPFLDAGMVVGLEEKVAPDGTVVKSVSHDEVRRAIESLLTAGARAVVVSLDNSFFNQENEQQVKSVIRNEYPRHYLGWLPVLLSAEVSNRPGQFERTNAAVLTAYLRRDMVRYLYKADEDLRRKGYAKPLLVVHSNGGVARVAKTTVLNTYNSGPVAGVFGAATVARDLYGLKDFITVDVGGTSVDLGIVSGGAVPRDEHPRIENLPINLPVVDVLGMGGGGGAIIRLDRASGRLRVGPESAGALPGPVAYGIGGTRPTLTDADLSLGFLNPEYFLGGAKKLDAGKARQAIERQLAAPLKQEVESVCWQAICTVEAETGRRIEEAIRQRGQDPRQSVMFAYGGGGGIRCCGYAQHIGIRKIYLFAFSPVFSAMGASTLDVTHLYERLVSTPLQNIDQADAIHQSMEQMLQTSYRDMRGEGFRPEAVRLNAEVEVEAGGQMRTILLPDLTMQALQGLAHNKSTLGGRLRVLRLKASCDTPHHIFSSHDLVGEDPTSAHKGRRQVFWGEQYVLTNIYDHSRLSSGNVIHGPAVVEGMDSTYVVPKGWRLTVDRYLNSVLEAIE